MKRNKLVKHENAKGRQTAGPTKINLIQTPGQVRKKSEKFA